MSTAESTHTSVPIAHTTLSAAAAQITVEAQIADGFGSTSPGGTIDRAMPSHDAFRPADSLLRLLADSLSEVEKVRIATSHRAKAIERMGGADLPQAERLRSMTEALAAIEHGAELELRRAFRKHPLIGFQKSKKGIGEKQLARLLAEIGDPAERRTVSQLWAYCGMHVLPAGQGSPDTQATPAGGQAPRRKRGQRANWNMVARSRVRLIAESCIKKMDSPYRPFYDAGRAKYADRDWSDLHKHNAALRLVAKAILRDLWVEARRAS